MEMVGIRLRCGGVDCDRGMLIARAMRMGRMESRWINSPRLGVPARSLIGVRPWS